MLGSGYHETALSTGESGSMHGRRYGITFMVVMYRANYVTKQFKLCLFTVFSCYGDSSCSALIGTAKTSVEACCESPANGGISASYYSTGSDCIMCGMFINSYLGLYSDM